MKNDSFLRTTIYKILRFLPDKWYLSLKFYKNFKRFPNWKKPKTFNEKLQWLKLYNRRPEYTIMVDKYEAKKYVANIIGDEYIIPTLGVWDKAEDIDFDSLPDKFVLKTTHDSGSVIICKDKSKLNYQAAIDAMKKSLKRDFYAITREWPYKNVKPRIIAEELLINKDKEDLPDYKFYCFDKEIGFMLITGGRFTGNLTFDYFDGNFNHLPFTQAGENAQETPPKPENFDKMSKLALELAKNIPHVRVDFYDVNNHIYFGELTFFDSSGLEPFNPEKWDYHWGDKINLPSKTAKK